MPAASSKTGHETQVLASVQPDAGGFGVHFTQVVAAARPRHLPPAILVALGAVAGCVRAQHHAGTTPRSWLGAGLAVLFGVAAAYGLGWLINRGLAGLTRRAAHAGRERRLALLRTAMKQAEARHAAAAEAAEQEQASRAMGTLQLLLGEVIGALRHLRVAGGANQHDGVLFNNAGVVLAQQDRLLDAYRALKRSRRMSPTGPWSDLNLCLVKLGLNQPGRALRYLERGLAGTQPPRWTLLQALLEERLGRPEAALDRLRQAPATRRDAYTSNALGVMLARTGQWAEAAAQLDAVVQWHPWLAAGRSNRGLLHLLGNRTRAAARELRAAAAAAPDDATIAANRGIVEQLLGHTDVALAALRHAAFREPNGYESHHNLSQLHLDRGHADEALAAAQHALRLCPDGREARLNRSAAKFWLAAFDDVIAELQPLVSQDDCPAGLWHNLALALAVSGRLDEAEQACQQAIRRAPAAPEHRQALAYTYHVNGQLHDAYRAYQEVLGLERSPWVCYHLGLTDYAMARYEPAVAWLIEALAKQPGLHQAYFPLGCAHAALNHAAQALSCWQRGLSSAPASPALLSNVGLAYYRRQRTTEAIDALRRAFFVRPDEPSFANNLALAYAQAGRYDQAADFFAKAVALRPKSVIARCNLGLAYYLGGLVEKAVEEWTWASQVDPRYFQRRQRQELQNTFDDVELHALDVDWQSRALPVPPITAGYLPRFLAPVPALPWQVVITEDMTVNGESLREWQDERFALLAG